MQKRPEILRYLHQYTLQKMRSSVGYIVFIPFYLFFKSKFTTVLEHIGQKCITIPGKKMTYVHSAATDWILLNIFYSVYIGE